ncbi:MAG: hypothetical protein V9G11_00070 [Bifidobacterium adolescentis]
MTVTIPADAAGGSHRFIQYGNSATGAPIVRGCLISVEGNRSDHHHRIDDYHHGPGIDNNHRPGRHDH